METGAIVQPPCSKIVGYAERIISVATDFLRQAGQPLEYGGHLLVRERKLGSTVLLAKLGHLKEDGWEDDITTHSLVMNGHIRGAEDAAWQVFNSSPLTSFYLGRRPEFNRRAGAVLGHSLIFSFYSAHEQFLDEAAMFALAIRLHQLRTDDVLAQISEERNPHLRPLLEACHWTE